MSDSAYMALSRKVRERENYLCAACGANTANMTWWSIQHRRARGTGGKNEIENMVLLCGSATSQGCHLKCEQRDATMHERGFWLFSWEPLTTPVTLFTGERVLLGEGYTYLDTPGRPF
jgi:5-methylcytosine-specific restriction endonuclease McrA